MKLTVLSSGSDGNGYLLECGNEVLILECGVALIEAKRALKFDLSKIAGVYISHAHGDHAKYRREYELLGVDVVAPYDTDKIRVNAKVGGFDLQAFRLPHGDTFSYGALIRHSTGETVLFMTDFEYCRYMFNACKVNHYIIECNYQPMYVELYIGNKEHKLSGHCSIDTCKRFLKTNQNEYMKSVTLVHLGRESTVQGECESIIRTALDNKVAVNCARKNTVFDYNA